MRRGILNRQLDSLGQLNLIAPLLVPISIRACVGKGEPVGCSQQHNGIRESGLHPFNPRHEWRSGPDQNRPLITIDFGNANNLEAWPRVWTKCSAHKDD